MCKPIKLNCALYHSNIHAHNIDKKGNQKIKANPIAPRVYLGSICFL
jgi:hypothetical protein